jgi:uncharacterized protein with beta-barrel porin domain
MDGGKQRSWRSAGRLILALCATFCFTATLEASETLTVGPFQLVFHQKGESYGGATADRDWTAAQMQAAQRAAQSWIDRISTTATSGSVPLHLMQSDLGVPDPVTGGVVVGQSSNPLGPTSASTRGTLEEQVIRDGRTTGLAGQGLIVLNTNAPMIYDAGAASASLTASGKLQRVLAHEIGHSMGFYGTGTSGTFTAPYTAYDNLLRDGTGLGPGPDFNPESAVTWAGTVANRKYGTLVPIYSPSPFAAGSSLYHIDIRNELMNYSLSNTSNTIRGASALEMAMFQDMGWTVNATNFNARVFADSYYEIINRDDLTAQVTSGVALQIINGGGAAGALRPIVQSGNIQVGEVGSIGIGLWSNYNLLLNSGTITAAGDYNAGIYGEGNGNVLAHAGTIDVTGAEATGLLVVGSDNRVFNTGVILARLTADGDSGTAIQFFGGGTDNRLYLQRGAALIGNLQTDAAAALSFGESTTALGTGDADFRLVFNDRILGAWNAVFWGGATALEKHDATAAANQFTDVEIKPGASLTASADMEVTGQVVVRSGATLAGTTTITRASGSTSTGPLLDSQAGATLRPGDVADSQGLPTNAIGTMTVAGDMTSNGNVQFDVTWRQLPLAAQHADQIAVTGGTATINDSARGTFAFSGENPNFAAGYDIARRYTILSTQGLGNLYLGARPQETDDLLARRLILRTNLDTLGFSPVGRTYYAYMGRDVPFGLLGRTENERAVGTYFDLVKWIDDGSFNTLAADLQWVRDTLDLMPDEADAARGLNRLGGEIYGSLGSVGSQRMFLAYNRLAQRVRDNLYRDPCDPPQHRPLFGTDDSLQVFSWVNGHGAGGGIHSDGNAGAYDFGSAGVQVGFGYRVQDRLAFGAFYDFDGLTLDDEFESQGSSSMHDFGGFASYRWDVAYMMVAAGGGISTYDVTRSVVLQNPVNTVARLLNGDHHGSQWGVYGEVGTTFGQGPTGLRPYLGLLYSGVHQNAFSETGGGITNLSVEADTANALRLLLGSQLDWRLPTELDTVLTLRGAWMHECLEDGGRTTAGFAAVGGWPTFVVRGIDLGQDWGILGTEIRTAVWRNILHLYGNYDLVLGSRQNLHTGGGGLEYVW